MAEVASVCAILLAAGAGRRFGGGKPLALRDGHPLFSHAVRALRGAGIMQIVAVLPPGERALHSLAENENITAVVNPAPSRGMGSSLAVGASFWASLVKETPGGALLLAFADMPAIHPDSIRVVVTACLPPLGIARPMYVGRYGHPVVFGAAHVPALSSLTGDVGARSILAAHPGRVVNVPVDDPGVLFDVDTREDLEKTGSPALPDCEVAP